MELRSQPSASTFVHFAKQSRDGHSGRKVEDIVVGLRDLETSSQGNEQNVIAHEIGHALTPTNVMFNDGYTDPADGMSQPHA